MLDPLLAVVTLIAAHQAAALTHIAVHPLAAAALIVPDQLQLPPHLHMEAQVVQVVQVLEMVTLTAHLQQHQYHHMEVLQDQSQAQIPMAVHLSVAQLEAAALMDLPQLQLHHHPRMEAPPPQTQTLIVAHQVAALCPLEIATLMDLLQLQLHHPLLTEVPLPLAQTLIVAHQVEALCPLEVAIFMGLLQLQLHHHRRMEVHLPQALIPTVAHQVAAHLEIATPMDPLQQPLLHLHMEAHLYQVAALFHLEVAALMDLPPLQQHHQRHTELPLPQVLILTVAHQVAALLEVATHMDPLQHQPLLHLHMEVPLCQVAAPFHLEVAAHMDLHQPQPPHHLHTEAQVVDLHQHQSHHTEAPPDLLQIQDLIAGHHHRARLVVPLMDPPLQRQHQYLAQTLTVFHQAVALTHMAAHLLAAAHLILIVAPLLQTMSPFITHKDTRSLETK